MNARPSAPSKNGRSLSPSVCPVLLSKPIGPSIESHVRRGYNPSFARRGSDGEHRDRPSTVYNTDFVGQRLRLGVVTVLVAMDSDRRKSTFSGCDESFRAWARRPHRSSIQVKAKQTRACRRNTAEPPPPILMTCLSQLKPEPDVALRKQPPRLGVTPICPSPPLRQCLAEQDSNQHVTGSSD